MARQHLLDARRQTRELINTRLKRGQAEGELDPDTDTEQMAMFLHGVMQAISFQARDGASKQALNSLIEPALRAWLSVGRSGKP
ncbi:TetR family transcriptional regulator C-terminal domain-containing protein [Kerstersia gyiorum]|uniref:TetR family transcriptional regulator C-terminal domain-containing protein n=1 Tax=Kerstersia gyiorum TaxID=206506 RepID=UPI003C6CCE3B